ncbi:MAG: hypothetical protein KDI92_13015 [Xanthomonadales bacterium]|nr:hypothetical protein [Xanthomonadales bacterium]
MKKTLLIGLLLSFHLLAQDTTDEWPEDDDWGNDWDAKESPWSQSGFLEAAYGSRINNDQLFTNQTTLSELRWHQQFQYSDEKVDFNWAYDVWVDELEEDLQFDLRELNFKFSLFGQTDVVLGRQISTWGTGDLLFINDMFPKDWQSFFSGRDDNYLKAPADALRFTSYFKPLNVDVVITPAAEPDRFINGERFALFSPFTQGHIGGFEAINPRNPNDPEYAIRLFKNFKGHQMALYGYHGIDKSPTGVDSTFQPYFPRKNVFGASFQSTLGQGLYNLEVGYHQALDDKDGDNPLVPNSQWRFLVGYERELIKKLNWGTQYYVEHTVDYDAFLANSFSPNTEVDKNRQVWTNRLTYQAMQDKLTWSLFMFYSPTDKDSYWRPSVNYRHNDQWQFTLGGNVFAGSEDHTFFGQFEDGSNLYARIRFQY